MVAPLSGAPDARGVRTKSVCPASLAICGLLVAAAACRSTTSTDLPGGPIHLTVGYPDPRLYAADAGIAVMVSQLEDERLMRLTLDGRFSSALAERWEQSPDGLTWRIYLRRDLRFHNGAPLDAAAVATSVRATMGAGARPGLRNVLSVEAPDPLQIIIHLSRPSRFVLDALSAVTIRTTEATQGTTGPAKVVGAGPFRIEGQTKDSATLSAFPGYFRGKPPIDRVDIRPYKDARSAWSGLMRGEIDMLYEVTPDVRDFIEGSKATQVRSFLKPFVFSLGVNMRHPVLRQRAVRLALNQAVNRDDIVKIPFGGRGKPAASVIWPKYWAYDERVPAFPYAPSEARRLLDDAGLPVKPAQNGQMPSRFRFTCLLIQNDARFERIALLLQRQLIDVGIDMQLEAVPAATLMQRLGRGQYDAYLLTTNSADIDWVYIFWHSPQEGAPAIIDSGYQAADAALDRLSGARTDEEMRVATADLQRVMHDDPPVVPLCWSESSRAISGRFRVPGPVDRDIWANVWQWQPIRDGANSSTTTAANQVPSPTP
jgi:peptide/nickel transport system substrate-binding protein